MTFDKDRKGLISQEVLQPLFDVGAIVYGSNGGLLLGNYHSEGGIKVIRKYDENLYEFVAELEGWEYIMCAEATYYDVEYLKKINNEFDGSSTGFVEYEIPNSITVIDTTPFIENIKETNKIVLFGEFSHFIINKYSTKKYLKELEEINKKYWIVDKSINK